MQGHWSHKCRELHWLLGYHRFTTNLNSVEPDPIFFADKRQQKPASRQIPSDYLSDGAERKEQEASSFPENKVPGLYSLNYPVKNNSKIIKKSVAAMKSPAFFNSKS